MASGIVAGVKERIEAHDLSEVLSISGDPSWSFLLFKDVQPYTQWQIKTLFLQEVFARGILTLGTHNMSYAHDENDVDHLLAVYDDVFPLIGTAIRERKLEQSLRCDPLVPLFMVR